MIRVLLFVLPTGPFLWEVVGQTGKLKMKQNETQETVFRETKMKHGLKDVSLKPSDGRKMKRKNRKLKNAESA